MKKILVTGGAGFIGSNFVRKFSRLEDYHFHVVDSLTYCGNLDNIRDLSITFEKLDIRDGEKVRELFERNDFAGVIHFAAETHVDNSIRYPNIFFDTNVMGTLNLLNCIGDSRLIHVSTDEVYGELLEGDPCFTEDSPLAPSSPYSASKASSDLLVRSYFKTYGSDVVITRCSNNYGPFQHAEKLIPKVIEKAIRGEKVPVYGDGANIRDWIYVDDHIEGIWRAFKEGRAGEVYNFGGGAEKRNIEVVRLILEKLGSKSKIEFVEDRKGHDYRYGIDYGKAQRELGWSPRVSFEEGIGATINFYNQTRSEQNFKAWVKTT